MSPMLLIAGREFRTYVGLTSFWIALVLGPLLVGASMVALGKPPTTTPVRIVAADGQLAQQLATAVVEAGAIEGKQLAPTDGAALAVTVSPGRGAGLLVQFDEDFPLSKAGRVLAVRSLENDRLRAGAQSAAPAFEVAAPPPQAAAPGAAARFAVVFMLWLTLTGSLGMLLQAVVRERTNRSLELLLASARPSDIVFGKVLGVGWVSLLVTGVWLASLAVGAAFGTGSAQLQAVLGALHDPWLLVRAAIIYVFGFTFYGLTTVALSARARDNAAAQNLSRPMFVILLVAFFAAMSMVGGGEGVVWLAFVPPFTPFVLLMRPPSFPEEGLALALLAGAAIAAAKLAIARTRLAA